MDLIFIGKDTRLFIYKNTQDVNCIYHIEDLMDSSAKDNSIEDIKSQYLRNIRILKDKITVQQKVAAYIKSDDFGLSSRSEKYRSILEVEEKIIKSLRKLKNNVMDFKETSNLSEFKLLEDVEKVTRLLRIFKNLASGVLYENQGSRDLGKQSKRKIFVSKFRRILDQSSYIRNSLFDFSDTKCRFETNR